MLVLERRPARQMPGKSTSQESLYPLCFKGVGGRQQRVDRLRQLFESLMLREDHVEGPAARRDLRNSSSNVVKPTIFVPGSMLRRTDAVSTPFIPGMLRSRITSAGARSLTFSTAATPSAASQQALKGVALSMKWQMASRTAALSSTTRIHGVRGDGIPEETTSVSC